MTASIILDIVFGILALLLVLKFTIKGFLRGILDTLKLFAAAILAYMLRAPVAKLLNSWFMDEVVVGWVKRSILNGKGDNNLIDFVELYHNVPLFFNNILSKFGLADASQLGNVEGASKAELEALAVDIGSSLSMFLSTVLAVVIMFFVNMLLLSILIRLLDCLTKFSVINVVNKVLGFCLGIVCSIGLIWLATFVIEILINVTGGFGGSLTAADLDDSMVVGLVRKII